ncbi:MAG TPA: ATP-binding protein [Pyrinomonadaceae bacterium]
MPHEFNPFTEQIVVEYFVGREYKLKQFRGDLSGLRAKMPNHQYIAGLNGTGKTSYLAKLVEIARDDGFLAVMPTLDAQSLSYSHISTIIRSIVAALEEQWGEHVPKIVSDWDAGKDSKYFYLPRTDELKSDRVRQDFEKLANLMKEAKIPGAVICIDEGQRIDGRAMSALKNALQQLNSYLVVLSWRLVSDTGGAVAAGRLELDTKATNEAEGDIGASRFYVTGIPIGPFETDQEAVDCIRRRLLDNVIQFDDEAIVRIGRIAKRLPKTMILIANNLYQSAQKDGVQVVTTELLNQTFRNMYQKEVMEAVTLLDTSPGGVKSALRGLLALRQPANPAAIATHLYPGTKPELLIDSIDGIRSNLDRACGSSSFCIKTQDRYDIPNSIHAYALELTLGIV